MTSRAKLVPLFLDPRGAAHPVAQVVELAAPDGAARYDLDRRERRRVQRERALHADTERDLANRERLTHASAPAADHRALEDLDALPVALGHAHVDLDGVTRTERRYVRPDQVFFDGVVQVEF